jgi:formate/nitrite transporter
MVEGGFLGPAELAHSFVDAGVKKSRIPIFKMMLLGVLAGLYIGFAAHLATTVATGWTIGGEPALFGLKKFLVGAVFSVGLMLVIIPGSELFTGNNLMTVSLCHGRLGFGGLFRNWIPVYASNLIGSVILAGIIASGTGLLDNAVGGTAIDIALGKVSAAPQGLNHNVAYFFRAVCCNFLVCIAVMMAISAKDIAGKVWAIFFPIMAFVASGFEHCVANMYFIPAGIFAKQFDAAVVASKKGAAAILASDLAADASIAEKAEVARQAIGSLNWSSMWTQNLLTVTLGNIIGGALFVGVVYYFLYVHGAEKK